MHIGSAVIDDDGVTGRGMQARTPPTFTFAKQKQCGVDPIKKILGKAGDNHTDSKKNDSGDDVFS